MPRAREDAEAGGDGLPATPSAASGAQRARELLGRLRVCEAAEELGRENSADWSPRPWRGGGGASAAQPVMASSP